MYWGDLGHFLIFHFSSVILNEDKKFFMSCVVMYLLSPSQNKTNLKPEYILRPFFPCLYFHFHQKAK